MTTVHGSEVLTNTHTKLQEGVRLIARFDLVFHFVYCVIRNIEHIRWSEKESHRWDHIIQKLKFCFDLVTNIKLSYFMIVEGDCSEV